MDTPFYSSTGDSSLITDPDLKQEVDKLILVCDVLMSKNQIENIVLFEYASNEKERIVLYKLYLFQGEKEVMFYLVLNLNNKKVFILPYDPTIETELINTTPLLFSYSAVLSMFLIFAKPFNPNLFLGMKIPIEGEY